MLTVSRGHPGLPPSGERTKDGTFCQAASACCTKESPARPLQRGGMQGGVLALVGAREGGCKSRPEDAPGWRARCWAMVVDGWYQRMLDLQVVTGES